MRTSWFIYIGILMLLGCETSNTVDPIYKKYFVKYYGKDGNQVAVDLVLDADENMYLLGNSTTIDGVTSPYLVKVNGEGNILWSRQIGGFNESAVDLEIIRSGIYKDKLVIVSNVGPAESSSIRITRLDVAGSGLDSTIIAGSSYPILNNAQSLIVSGITSLALKPGFVIAGKTSPEYNNDANEAGDQEDWLILPIDDNLVPLPTFSKPSGEIYGSALKVYELLDGDTSRAYVACGYSDNKNVVQVSGVKNDFEFDAEIRIQTASNRNFSNFGSGDDDQEEVVYSTDFSGKSGPIIALAGNTINRVDNSPNQVFISIFRNLVLPGAQSEPNLIPFSNTVKTTAIKVVDDGFLFIGSVIRSDETRDIVLTKINSSGKSKSWSEDQFFGTPAGDDFGVDVVQLADGRIAVFATFGLETQQKMALIMLHSNGKISN